MKKIFLITLIPFFSYSQKVSITPFYLTGGERICLSVTVENNTKNNFYFFQKLFHSHLYQIKNNKKISFDKNYYDNELHTIYDFRIKRDKKLSEEKVQLENHLLALKNKYIKEKYIDSSCNNINDKDDAIIKWYDSFLDNILFIPSNGGKVTFLTNPISINDYPKGEYTIISQYIEKQKFKVEDYDKCKRKIVDYLFTPEIYNGYFAVKSLPLSELKFIAK